MRWQGVENNAVYQRTEYNQAKAHNYYYVWRESAGKWKAGRFTLGREIDFRLEFSNAKTARAYCAGYDNAKSETIITEITA